LKRIETHYFNVHILHIDITCLKIEHIIIVIFDKSKSEFDSVTYFKLDNFTLSKLTISGR